MKKTKDIVDESRAHAVPAALEWPEGMEREGAAEDAAWECAGELVSFATAPDRKGHVRRLDGFWRDGGKGTPVLCFVHGMGSNFYRSRLKKAFLEAGPEFGFSVLSFNNAGAESGTENEDFRETLRDLDAAAAYGRRRFPDSLRTVPKPLGSFLWRRGLLFCPVSHFFLSRVLFMGYPQFGQARALSDTPWAHSGQVISMARSSFRGNYVSIFDCHKILQSSCLAISMGHF